MKRIHLPRYVAPCRLASLAVILVTSLLGTVTARAELTRDDVLTWSDGHYYLDGNKFAEIGWNKFDLFWAMWEEVMSGRELTDDNPIVQSQDRALGELASIGTRTIRFFATPFSGNEFFREPELREKYYAVMDKCIELIEKHGLSAVVCLGAKQFTSRHLVFDEEKGRRVWAWDGDHERDLLTNPDSDSRKLLYEYLDDVVPRYRERKGVLMWEVSNEFTNNVDVMPDTKEYNGERKGTLADLAAFYTDVAERIRSLDPLRMVTNGGSRLRPSAWNQFKNNAWKLDTMEEHLQAYELVYGEPLLDVIDIHYYGFPLGGYEIADQTLMLKDYVEIVEGKLGKPVYFGEFGPLPKPRTDKVVWKAQPEWFESYEDKEKAAHWFHVTADEIVESGVQLAYWWAYSSDRKQDQNLPHRMDVSLTRNPELVKIVVDANRRLKEKFGVKTGE